MKVAKDLEPRLRELCGRSRETDLLSVCVCVLRKTTDKKERIERIIVCGGAEIAAVVAAAAAASTIHLHRFPPSIKQTKNIYDQPCLPKLLLLVYI